ncbi:pyridoxal phosphate-dependent decarboxylase family protein [Flavisolibacter ginsenosidimutans]|uniref:Aminotransferase class I/II-fold pyridoxal phosphate-dependent enzyme n=1 Tax=Flavisolibacter ginsenosidimutans TaxID=661481 RepID=A0A5B8UDW1_9BACT|nr:aminotransferase class I/II-fold pyridoxal phosphate-dependent enzyme [Flavisolibacter ginsenosidimutans]QEC54535.1 aminotransferase class I/II-fold pyridoxal phosphate-dependent enzyme [Flavisolibacter ginsenosidimutans]
MQHEEFRQAGHYLVDYIADYLNNVSGKALFPDVEPSFLYELFDEAIPQKPKPLAQLQKELEEKLMPYLTHVNHPGYMGLITPSPNPAGILADLLASAINQNVGAYTIGPSAVAMERRVIRWLNDLIGYDENAGGNLTSGGMMANFIGIKLGRDWTTGDTAQHEGLHGEWAVYVSEERHVSIDKSVDAAGIGRNYLRALPTDESYRVRIDALEEAIANDKAKGIKPICIVGLAGTTNLGAVDDLEALSKIAKRENCWFHVDAAYGGGMLLSQKYPTALKGLSLADSVTIDPHKWFYAPLDAGAVLVKDHQRLTKSFGIQHAYLTDRTNQKSERYQFYVHGFEQSKRFRSLKVWASFQHYGKEQIGEWIDQNIAQAKHLHRLAIKDGLFESAIEPPMSAICLHYKGNDLTKEQSKALHYEVAARMERGGKFWFASTEMKGKTWFRINPVNIHTTLETMDALYALLKQTCKEVEAEMIGQREIV